MEEKINVLYRENDLGGNLYLPEIINIDNTPSANLSYSTLFSSGFDFCSAEKCTVEPRKARLVKTGLKFCLHDCEYSSGMLWELQIRSRSGLAVNHGIVVLNSPGTVDMDYEGEIKICLFNHSETPFIICEGDRIAQGVFAPVFRNSHIKTKDKKRGEGGFGSTGIKGT